MSTDMYPCCKTCHLTIISECRCEQYEALLVVVLNVIANVHAGDMRSARNVWGPFTAYEPVEAKAVLAAYHMDRCLDATRAFNKAFAYWHASIVLERHSEPDRWTAVEAAHAHLASCTAALHQDFPDREDEAPDTERTPTCEAAEIEEDDRRFGQPHYGHYGVAP